MVRNIRLVQTPEFLPVLGPWESAAIDDDAAETVAVSAKILGERMHDDVGAMLDGAAQIGRSDGIVDDQRNAVRVGDVRQTADVGDIAARVADRLAEHGFGFFVDQLAEGIRIAVVGEADFDAVLRQGVGKEVVGAAVKRAGRDDVVARLGQGLNGGSDGGHAGSKA